MELTPYNYLHPAKWTLPRMFILKTNLSKLGIHSKMGNFLFCSKWFFFILFTFWISWQFPTSHRSKASKNWPTFFNFIFENKLWNQIATISEVQPEVEKNWIFVESSAALNLYLSLSASLSQTLSLIHIPKNSLSVSLSHSHTKSLTLSFSLFAISLTQIHSALYTPSALTLSRSLT